MTIVDFIQENMRVLATVCDRSIGGRNFDDVIVEFLAESFQKKTGTCVRLVIMCHVMSLCVMSYHVISCHIMSYHIMSYHVISYHVISCHIMSYHVISCHIISCHIMSCHVISCHIIIQTMMELILVVYILRFAFPHSRPVLFCHCYDLFEFINMTSILSDDFLISFNPISCTVHSTHTHSHTHTLTHTHTHTHTHIGTNVRDNVKAVLKLQAAAEKAKKVRTYVCMRGHTHTRCLSLISMSTYTPLPCHGFLFCMTHAIISSV